MSDDPVRLLDDPSVSRAMRDDLARTASAPAPFDQEGGLAKLSAAIQVGGPVGSGPGAGGGASGSPGAGTGGGMAADGAADGIAKTLSPNVAWWIAGALAIGATLGVAHGLRGSAPTTTAPFGAPASAVVSAAVPADEPLSSAGAQASAEAPIATANAAEPETRAGSEPAGPRGPAPAGTASSRGAGMARDPAAMPDPVSSAPVGGQPTGSHEAGPSALAQETARLAELRAAAASDPARALALAVETDRAFPRGVFSEEREAIAVGALARLGRTSEARARAEAFLATHPKSPFAEGVRRAGGLH